MLKPIKIFFCYAHEDEDLLRKLKTQLSPLQRVGLIAVWHDRDISAGTEWEEEISKQLESAQIILLLVSPDFVASDYCYSKEMQRALQHLLTATALNVLRIVAWLAEPSLRGTQISRFAALALTQEELAA